MTAHIPTPMLDKAAVEELTSSEIFAALLELRALDPDQGFYELHTHWTHGGQMQASICRSWTRGGRWHSTIEDALVAEHKDLASVIAEIEAA